MLESPAVERTKGGSLVCFVSKIELFQAIGRDLSQLTPLLLLLAGALALLLGLLPRFRHTGPIAVAAALAALAMLLWMALGLPVRATLSDWRPPELFRTGLVLNVDGLSWLFALAVLAAAIAALVTGLAVRAGGGSATGSPSCCSR